jgi:hypothetical protein
MKMRGVQRNQGRPLKEERPEWVNMWANYLNTEERQLPVINDKQRMYRIQYI